MKKIFICCSNIIQNNKNYCKQKNYKKALDICILCATIYIRNKNRKANNVPSIFLVSLFLGNSFLHPSYYVGNAKME